MLQVGDIMNDVFVGVDVAKKSLAVHLYPKNKGFIIENDTNGITLLLDTLRDHEVASMVCESSGGYESLFLESTRAVGYTPWVVDPRRVKNFILAEGSRVKTDLHDAKMLALFASKMDPAFLKGQPSDDALKLKSLVRRRMNLTTMSAEEKKRIQHPSLKHSKEIIEEHISFLKDQIKKVEKDILQLARSNAYWNHRMGILTSMPGVGDMTAAVLLAELPELGTFTPRTVAAIVGVAPYTNMSGAYVGKAFIKGGRFELRRFLYMSAVTASWCNPYLSKFYKRLKISGKPTRVALVAVIKKMVVILNAMVKHDKKFECEGS